MANIELPARAGVPARYVATAGTVAAAALAVLTAQVGFAVPAVLTGLFQQDLSPTSAQLTWIQDAYLIPVCLLELTFGVLGDLFGRKRLLVGGALLIAAGEAVAFFTPGPGAASGTRVAILLLGQVIAGIGAAAVFPTSLAMLAAGTHTARDRARAIAIWAAFLATAGLVAPVLGGLTTKVGFGADPSGTWHWTYLVVLLLALASAALSKVAAQESAAPEGRSLDWPGQVTAAVAVFAVLFAVIQGPTSGWGSAEVIGGFLLGAVFLALFIAVERRSAAPLLRLDFFTHRAFAVNSVITVIGMAAFIGVAYSTSVRISTIQGGSPLRTAVAFIFISGLTLPLMPLTGRLLERSDPRWLLGAGLALIGAGALWLAAVPATDTSLVPIIAPLVLAGIGFALAVTSVTTVAVGAMPSHLAGMASATTNMLRDFGFTLGPAVIGAVALSQAAGRISGALAGSPSLRGALAAFNAAPAHAPAAQRPALEGAVHAVASGPLGANGVPGTITVAGHAVPFNPLKDVAFDALSHGYSTGFLITGILALTAAVLAFAGLGGGTARAAAEEA